MRVSHEEFRASGRDRRNLHLRPAYSAQAPQDGASAGSPLEGLEISKFRQNMIAEELDGAQQIFLREAAKIEFSHKGVEDALDRPGLQFFGDSIGRPYEYEIVGQQKVGIDEVANCFSRLHLSALFEDFRKFQLQALEFGGIVGWG